MPRYVPRVFLPFVLLLLAVAPLSARVLSYAPYTDQTAIPATQHRLNRHFVLLELASQQPFGNGAFRGQLVVYDSTGAEEPRVVFPAAGAVADITHVAARALAPRLDPRTEERATLAIFVRHMVPSGNGNTRPAYALSTNGGTTWTEVVLPLAAVPNVSMLQVDHGGPFARAAASPILIGTAATPFVIALPGEGVYAVGADATTRRIAFIASDIPIPLAGSDVTGSKMLVRTSREQMSVVDLSGNVLHQGAVDGAANITYTGWITPENAMYVVSSRQALSYIRNGVSTTVELGGGGITPVGARLADELIAAPTADYSGAWYTARRIGQSTILHSHSASSGVVTHWTDTGAPQVEALHAGRSGQKLLIQVHRPRPLADQRLFLDPALAVWHVGQGAPPGYDELFMDEAATKGFVHVDVDRMEEGEAFVFDSGARLPQFIPPPNVSPPLPSPPPTGGGGDVIQEWGVVRSSLKQQLVLPGIGRTRGGFGSDWSSDVTLYNPLPVAQKVTVRYSENGEHEVSAAVVRQVTLTLGPSEIRVIEDALKTLFALESGSGAFFLTPEAAINASSRTFSRAANGGTFGFNMNAIDVFSAASPRFPVSFAGAFPGANFRTNLVVTDAASGGTEASLTAVGPSGFTGTTGVSIKAPAVGQNQLNNLAPTLGFGSSQSGGLFVRPLRGFAIASLYTIDNRSNDPTYFPPDMPAPIVRTIPAIGHLDGANGTRFRSDLYLYNPSTASRSVTLQAQSWNVTEPARTFSLTLLPNEARLIPDALFTLFNKSGIARLRYTSFGDSNGVRVTSRTYTVDAEGATYGFLMPPLNEFQHASGGETLEILGTRHDPRFRTNLGLVELSLPTGNPVLQTSTVTIELVTSGGRMLDRFTVTMPQGGGMQINDLFGSRNITDAQPVLIRVTANNGVVGAFASMLDNTTNDPSYVAANLAASP